MTLEDLCRSERLRGLGARYNDFLFASPANDSSLLTSVCYQARVGYHLLSNLYDNLNLQ